MELRAEELENGEEEIESLLFLADCYVHEDNVDAAISSYERAYSILLKTRGANDKSTVDARDWIRTLTGKWPD